MDEIIDNCYKPAGYIITVDLKLLLIQEYGLLYIKDLNTGFLNRYTSKNVMKKLLVPYKKFVIDGASESMLNQML